MIPFDGRCVDFHLLIEVSAVLACIYEFQKALYISVHGVQRRQERRQEYAFHTRSSLRRSAGGSICKYQIDTK